MATFKDYYDQVMQEISSEYTQRRNDYETTQNAAKQGEYDALDTWKTSQKDTINQTSDKALNDAYINMMTTKRDLPDYLSSRGIYGGGSETIYANMIRDYENSRNNTEGYRIKNLTDMGNTYQTQKSGIDSSYKNALNNYISQLDSEKQTTATNRAGILYQAYQDELDRQEQARQFNESLAAQSRNSGGSSSQSIIPDFEDSTASKNQYGSGYGSFAGSGVTSYSKDQENYEKALAAQRRTTQQRSNSNGYIPSNIAGVYR